MFIREIAVVKNKIKRYTNTTWGESNNSGVVVVPALLTITISGHRWLNWEAFFLVRCVFFYILWATPREHFVSFLMDSCVDIWLAKNK